MPPVHYLDPPPPNDPASDASGDGPALRYRLHEGAFRLPGAWEDRTVTMLRPGSSDGGGASIVVTRDKLPAALTLSQHVERQRAMFQKELPGFTLLQDVPGELDAHLSHLLEFHWDNQGVPLYQAVVIVQDGRRLLNFTASAPRNAADLATRRALLQSISSFRFAAPEGPAEALPA